MTERDALAVPDSLLRRGLADGLYTHAVCALARDGQTVAHSAFGKASLTTIFDLASLTKPIATATLVLQLTEAGALHLHQSVAGFLEADFGPLPHLADVQVRHLLTHTSGLPPLPRWPAPTPRPTRADCMRAVLQTPLLRPPGVGYTYSDTGYILLGEIVSRAAHTPLDTLFTAQIARPLGMNSTGFVPAPSLHTRIAPTTQGASSGTVHDPRAADMAGVAGHAGLFGTAADVLLFAECVRSGAAPLVSRAAAARMAVSQIPLSMGGQSFAFFCAGNDFLPAGDLFSDHAFGHSGFTGVAMLVDPAFAVSVVLCANRVVNDAEDGSRFLRLRRLWLNAAAAVLT